MKCSKCGNELNDGDLFCGKCGNKIKKSSTKKFSIRQAILIITISTVILLILIISLMTYLVNLSNSTQETEIKNEKEQIAQNNIENNIDSATNGIELKGKKTNGDEITLNFKDEELNRFKDVADNQVNKYFNVEYEELLNKYGTAAMTIYSTEQSVYLLYDLDNKEIKYLLNYKCTTPAPVMVLYDSYNLIYENIDEDTNKVSWEFRTGGQQEYIYTDTKALNNYQTRFAKYTSARDEDYELVKSIVENTNNENIAIFDISNL